MQDRELYRQISGLESPWKIERVELRRADSEVHVFLEHDEQVRWRCPECSTECGLHDHQPERRLRHSTAQFYMPGRPAATAPSTGRGWCNCPRPPAASRRYLKLSRSRG